MGEKLYLIRVNLESFIGPYTLSEVRSAYKRMLFGLQDEIAASNMPWVSFDDLLQVKEHYPELMKFVKQEMLSGWAVTDQSVQIDAGAKRKIVKTSTTSGSANGSGSNFLLSIVLVAVIFAGSLLILKNSGVLKRLQLGKKDPKSKQ